MSWSRLGRRRGRVVGGGSGEEREGKKGRRERRMSGYDGGSYDYLARGLYTDINFLSNFNLE